MGAWQRPGSGKQAAQVQLVFEKDSYGVVALARGFANTPFGEGEVVVRDIKPDKQECHFQAVCAPRNISGLGCTVIVDPVKDTLVVASPASRYFDSKKVWTRASGPPPQPPAQATCSRADIEGDWLRSDGATVPIVGVETFKNGVGGNALIFGHPGGWWPKGTSKFRAIYRDGGAQSCKLKAICASYDRRASGAVERRERACELVVDPAKRTMTESGSSVLYSRPGGTKAPAAKPAPAKPAPTASAPPAPPPPDNAAEKAATGSLNAQQAAAAKREIADYEARKKRIADEQAAKEAAYRKALADRDAQIAEIERKAREDRLKWEAAVAACKAGDRSHCGPTPK